MCPTAETLTGEMVGVETNGVSAAPAATTNHSNGVTGNGIARPPDQPRNPYAPRYSDFLSNVSNFKIIESTLRGNFRMTLTRYSGSK
jgi:homocitrate synthase